MTIGEFIAELENYPVDFNVIISKDDFYPEYGPPIITVTESNEILIF